MSQQGSTQFDHACDSALGWIARLRSDAVTEEDHQSFALWLAEDQCHLAAMDLMLELWDDLEAVAHLPAPTSKAAPPEAANHSSWYVGAAVAASLALAVVFWPQFESAPDVTQYQTAMGEQRSVQLPDDSKVVLNTDSSISVSYREDQRHIILERGEAWFQVLPNEARPFHVDAGEARVTAIGTAFNIYLDSEATAVTVTEGVVRVSELGATGNRAPTAEILRVNDSLRVSLDGWDLSSTERSDHAMAWQRGELIAEEMTLAELVRQIERYHPTRIMISDPEIALMTVSGVFALEQPEAILNALEISLDIRVDELDDNTVRLLKAGH